MYASWNRSRTFGCGYGTKSQKRPRSEYLGIIPHSELNWRSGVPSSRITRINPHRRQKARRFEIDIFFMVIFASEIQVFGHAFCAVLSQSFTYKVRVFKVKTCPFADRKFVIKCNLKSMINHLFPGPSLIWIWYCKRLFYESSQGRSVWNENLGVGGSGFTSAEFWQIDTSSNQWNSTSGYRSTRFRIQGMVTMSLRPSIRIKYVVQSPAIGPWLKPIEIPCLQI